MVRAGFVFSNTYTVQVTLFNLMNLQVLLLGQISDHTTMLPVAQEEGNHKVVSSTRKGFCANGVSRVFIKEHCDPLGKPTLGIVVHCLLDC